MTRCPRRTPSVRALAALVAVLLVAACRSTDAPDPGASSPEHLLTDAEMRTAEDPDAPSEDAATVAWIQAHSTPVRSLVSSDFSDLQFLKPILAGKRLVLLGESGHGVGDFDLAKVRLVRFLHEEMGFDVMAFESGAYECHGASEAAAAVPAVTTMRSCIFGVWHAQEVLPLFDYIRASRATSRPLTLAGFDVQPSSWTGIMSRPANLAALIGRIDPAYAARARALDSTILERNNAGALPVYAQEGGAVLESAYDSVARFLGARQREILAGHPEDSTRARILRISMRGMPAYLREVSRATSADASMVVRDTGMARVLDFLADSVYPGRRIILWAHNYHVRNDGPAAAPMHLMTMGTDLARRRRAEMYTIGLYMYRGQAATNNRQVYWVSRGKAGSLESILYRTRRKYAFIDLAGQTLEPGSGWIFHEIGAFDWGTSPWTLIPRDQYDGILFVDTTSPPTYM